MKQHSTRFQAAVNEAKQHIKETDVETVHKRIEAGEQFHLIDVREDREWLEAHIPGSIHLGKGIIERDIEKLTADSETEVVLYCGGGYRSALAAQALQTMGYQNVISMDGGISAWHQAGYALARPEE